MRLDRWAGPTLFEQQPEIVGGVFMVYLASNVLLLFLAILTTPIFVSVLRLKKSHLIPIVLLMCAIGTFALQASVFDLWVIFGFGLVGILFRAARYPLAPIVIGTILGPVRGRAAEEQSLVLPVSQATPILGRWLVVRLAAHVGDGVPVTQNDFPCGISRIVICSSGSTP